MSILPIWFPIYIDRIFNTVSDLLSNTIFIFQMDYSGFLSGRNSVPGVATYLGKTGEILLNLGLNNVVPLILGKLRQYYLLKPKKNRLKQRYQLQD